MERWLPVPGFEGVYEVSDHGRVRSLDRIVARQNRWGTISHDLRRGRILKPGRNAADHWALMLCDGENRRQVFVHHLVLEAFDCARPDGLECRHLDGNPANNKLSNIVWGTRLENMADRGRLGEHNAPRGIRNRRAILNEEKVRFIRSEKAMGRRNRDIAKALGVNRNVICKVLSGYTWAWLK